MKTAKGTFNPDLKPKEFFKNQEGCARMTIDKTFDGALSGHSYGEMLSSIGSPAEGNGGYVVIERFQGELDGKKGAFTLMHCGKMEDGKDSLILEVVPGTGKEEMTGIKGSMTIDVDESGGHHYILSYENV